MCVLVFVLQIGPASCGKTSTVQLLATLTGNTLDIMPMNSAMDTTELLGGFEQVRDFLQHVLTFVSVCV